MANEGYSILDVINEEYGVILTKNGCISVAFRMYNPECYSLHRTDLENRNRLLNQAFKHLPPGSFVHKQDVFLKKSYVPELKGNSFIAKAERAHFSGREYLDHRCLLIFTLSGLESLRSAYNANPFAYREQLHKNDLEKLSDFLEGVSSAAGVINNIKDTKLEKMDADELAEYIAGYINFFPDAACDRDVHFAGEITVGKEKARYYTICEEGYLPDSTLSTDVEDSTLPLSGCSLFMSELEGLGVHLYCNHVVNQVIFFEGSDKLYQELSHRVGSYRTNKDWDPGVLGPKAEDLETMQKEISSEKQILCRTNFSVMIWDDDAEKLERSEKKIKELLTVSDFKFYMPSYEHLANVHLASVPGHENGLDRSFLFLSPLSLALCLFINYTTFTSDREGIYFNDRIYQIPLKKDIWDAGKKRIPARNAIVVASTGGGKSVLSLNIVQQLIELDYIIVVVEFGYSFGHLCNLYPEISVHVDYDGNTPLGLNPFDLEDRPLDDNKIEVLSGIIQRFWQRVFGKKEKEQSVALTKFIQDYYANVPAPHSFPSFYHHVKDNFSDICKRKGVLPKYFDLDSFLLVCSEFLKGERYENVCRTEGTASFSNKRFIVFELTQIKQNKFLSDLVMALIFDVIHDKILSDRTKRGMIIFDEYAETAQMKDSENDISIHSAVAFCYQKIRKENGAIMTIVQSPDQLPDDEFTKGMITNTQLLYILPTTDVVYKAVEERFQMSEEYQRNMMRSIRNDFAGAHPYSETFIRFTGGQGKYAIVVRNELSREKFLAFQTDGDTWAEIDGYSHTMPMEKAIEKYMENHQQ